MTSLVKNKTQAKIKGGKTPLAESCFQIHGNSNAESFRTYWGQHGSAPAGVAQPPLEPPEGHLPTATLAGQRTPDAKVLWPVARLVH